MSPTVNFEKTLSELKKYLSLPIQNDRDRAGIIQAFEFTFEQSWKSIQKIASTQGSEVASPKAAFTFAMQNGWIDLKDEAQWLELIKDRNLTSHTYAQDLAKEVLGRIQKQYTGLFDGLLKSLQKQK